MKNNRENRTTDPPEQEIHAALLQRLYGNALKLVSSSTLSAGIGFLSFALTARALGASEFGNLALIVAFTAAILRLCEFQSWQALIQVAADYRAQGKNNHVIALFRLGMIIDFLSCTAALTIALVSIKVFSNLFNWGATVVDAAYLYVWVLPLSIKGTPTAILRHFNQFTSQAVHQITSAGIKLLVIIFVIGTTPSFENFVFAWMAGHILEHLILLSMGTKSLLTKNNHNLSSLTSTQTIKLRAVASKSLLRYLAISNLDSTLRMVRELDVQFVALFVDSSAAGILRVARQLATFATRLLDSFYTAIYPDLAKLAATNKWHSLNQLSVSSSVRVGILGFVGLLSFGVFGEWFMSIAFGFGFDEAYHVTLLLLSATTIWGFVQPFSAATLAMGKPEQLLKSHTVSAICYLCALYLFVPSFGVMGAGWAMFILYAVWSLILFSFYRYNFNSRVETDS